MNQKKQKRFTYETLDSLLLDLKLFSIEEGDKICVSENLIYQLIPVHFANSARWYNNDSRIAMIILKIL